MNKKEMADKEYVAGLKYFITRQELNLEEMKKMVRGTESAIKWNKHRLKTMYGKVKK